METHVLQLAVQGHSDGEFDVRKFVVDEALHELFRIEIEAVSENADVDLDAVMGAEATFRLQRHPTLLPRSWRGIVVQAEHVGIDADQLSTYRLLLRPQLWLLTQRRNYRVFQQMSDPDVVLEVLRDWGLEPRVAYDRGAYLGRKYRVQYAETDFAFVRRLLEDAGITFFFSHREGETELVLSDAPQRHEVRPLAWVQRHIGGAEVEIATHVEMARRLRPGRYTQRDVDWRRSPEFPLLATDSVGGIEDKLERFHHNYGAFLYCAPGGDTPVADDRGAARTQLDVAQRQVERRLAAKRVDATAVRFHTTAHEIAPGRVVAFVGHPHPELREEAGLLVERSRLEGTAVQEWYHEVEARFAAHPYHPPLSTPKPQTFGIESATVVGVPGDDIHTDEFARIRVQFHWDREGQRDSRSSCWIPVNQPWGGAGFGALNIPRVGQEVLVDFLGEDPDRPVVVGRVFTRNNPVPYTLPKHKTVNGIRSQSSNQPLAQIAQQLMAAGAGAVEGALQDMVGEVLGTVVDAATQAFGDRMPPLASLIPDAAQMLGMLAQPGGASFVAPDAPAPPEPDATDGSPTRATIPQPPEYPEGLRGPRGEPAPIHHQPLPEPTHPVAPDAPPIPTAPDALPTMPDLPSPPAPAATPPARPPMPEVPMGPRRLQAALDNGFGAASPNGETQNWAGSELSFDDTDGSERLYLQAQRDMNLMVRNNQSAVIGSSRSVKVGTSDVLEVGQYQVIRTGDHRAVDVRANQVHMVKSDINQTSAEGSQRFMSAEAHTTDAKALVWVAEERLGVDCGPPPPEGPFIWNISGLLMRPDHVLLDGPKLFLNPGQDALAQAMATGEAPETGESQRNAAHAAAVDGALSVYEEAWRQGDLSSSVLRRDVERSSAAMETYSPEARNQAWDRFLEARGDGAMPGPFGSTIFAPPE